MIENIILDIDGTLIDADYNNSEKYDFKLSGGIFVRKKEFLDEFLDFCFKNFNVCIYSAAHYQYIDEIINMCFSKLPQFIFSSDDCILINDGLYSSTKKFKHIDIVFKKLGWNKDNTLFVDDRPELILPKKINNVINPTLFKNLKELIYYINDIRNKQLNNHNYDKHFSSFMKLYEI